MLESQQSWQQVVHRHIETAHKPIVCIVGTTASGKTGLSIDVCNSIGAMAEVINADSRQLYRGMDIGTAKITKDEMQGVPHRMIDVLNPSDEATAGWFQSQVVSIIDGLHAKSQIPVLVGGSMLYVSSIVDGLSMAPKKDPVIRERLMNEYAQLGGEVMHQKLQHIDPSAAKNIHPNNIPHLIRALEIHELCNQPKSSAVPKNELRIGESVGGYDVLMLGVHRDREVIVDRINRRAKLMFEHGWLDEVQQLVDAGYSLTDPGMKSHGYKEIMEYLLNSSSMTEGQLCESIAAKTRQYAKRQTTWWRNDSRIQWIDGSIL